MNQQPQPQQSKGIQCGRCGDRLVINMGNWAMHIVGIAQFKCGRCGAIITANPHLIWGFVEAIQRSQQHVQPQPDQEEMLSKLLGFDDEAGDKPAGTKKEGDTGPSSKDEVS